MADSTDTEEKKDKKIAFMGTFEYRAELQREALERGMKVQSLLEMAVAEYLANHPAPKRALPIPRTRGKSK